MIALRRWCSIGGPAILLVAWVTQQFIYDYWNGKLNRLDAAEGIWETFRSNNYLFNVLNPNPGNPEVLNQAVSWQLKNLKIGAGRIERLISPDILQKAGSDVMEAEDGGSGTPTGHMDIRFKTILIAINAERERLQSKKIVAGYSFWTLYLLGGIVTLLGNILKEIIEYQREKRVN